MQLALNFVKMKSKELLNQLIAANVERVALVSLQVRGKKHRLCNARRRAARVLPAREGEVAQAIMFGEPLVQILLAK